MKTLATLALLAGLILPAAAAKKEAAPAKTKVHQQLDALGAKIDEFAARTAKESAGTRERLEKRLHELRADQTQANSALSKLEAAGASAGKDLQTGFQRAYQKLKDGYRQAMQEAPWSKTAPAAKPKASK